MYQLCVANLFLSPRNRVGGDIVTRPFVGGWVSEWVGSRNRVGGDIVTRPFVGGWVSEWVGSWVRGWVRGSVTLYLVDTIPSTVFAQSISTSHAHLPWWEEEPYRFWVTGSKVKVNFRTLYIKPCGHDSDYSFCPITFKLRMHICHDERRNPIDFGSRGQRSRSTLALCI